MTSESTADPPSGRGRSGAARGRGPRRQRLLRRAVIALGCVVLLVVVVAGAGAGFLYYQGTRAPLGGAGYVALGSSFAAGPGVGRRAPDSPTLCGRSDRNYAQRLAAVRHLDLTDVTCSGATAAQVVDGGQYFQPAQLDALRPDTMLVTATVGGNDISYLGNLWAWSCRNDPAAVPVVWRPLVCTPTADDEVERELGALPATMQRLAEQVHSRSPRARLVFVDYTTVLPETGSCPDRLPLTAPQLDRSRVLAARLVDITAATARNAGALLVRASDVTRGHDVCSPDPWVFGLTFAATPFQYGPAAFHPTEQAMTRIAAALDQALSARPPP